MIRRGENKRQRETGGRETEKEGRRWTEIKWAVTQTGWEDAEMEGDTDDRENHPTLIPLKAG